jgi:molybdopterin-guanine dinucleotide biosynthesis protein A
MFDAALDDPCLPVDPHPPQTIPVLVFVVVDDEGDVGVGADVLEADQIGRRLRLEIDDREELVTVDREAQWHDVRLTRCRDRGQSRDARAENVLPHLPFVHRFCSDLPTGWREKSAADRLVREHRPVACAGVLLTGGSSRRLGFDKAVVRIGTETLAERAARVLGSVCSPIVEVGPGRSGARAVREKPVGSGPLAALVAGADALGAASVVLLGCDLVRIERPLLALLAGWDGAASAVPIVGGMPQLVCARYGADALEAARGLLAVGEGSLRALLDAVAVDLVPETRWGAVADAETFADLDTPDDLARLGLRAPD